MVLWQGLGLASAGIVLGLGASLALTRLMSKMLYHVSTTDPSAFAGGAVLFAAVAMVASYLPARKATRVDPTVALRWSEY
jgi:ABC-type antimicrobial peptide transport system permease subunit